MMDMTTTTFHKRMAILFLVTLGQAERGNDQARRNLGYFERTIPASAIEQVRGAFGPLANPHRVMEAAAIAVLEA